MKIVPNALQLLCLLSLLDPSNAQGGGGGIIRQFIDTVTDAVGDVGDFFSGALDGGGGGLGGLVSGAIDFVVLSVATAVLGDDPEELACNLIQEELAQQPDVTCTCESDITVATTTADLSGTCGIPRTCPVPGACGACSADYNGSGDVALTDQTIDGSAVVTGSCKLDEITVDIGITEAVFDFTATLNFDGGFSSLDLIIASCTADFKDASGTTTLSTCNCSPDGCGPLEISYTCAGSFAGLSSNGCVSLTGLGGN